MSNLPIKIEGVKGYIYPHKVMYASRTDKVVTLHLSDTRSVHLKLRMDDVFKLVPSLVRVHQCYCVNQAYVQDWHYVDFYRKVIYLILKGGQRVPVSAPYQHLFTNSQKAGSI